MYKININENTLYLMSSSEMEEQNKDDFGLIAPYTGKTKTLLSYVDMLEKTRRISKMIIYYSDYKVLKDDFKSLFKIIKASGGVVLDEESKVLMIFRRGFWDLPKGKLDEGETKKEAAVREVVEETGISTPKLIKKTCKTHHVYRLKNRTRVLKTSHWYLMEAPNQKLIPQSSEDIVEAKWVNPKRFITKDLPIYVNIIDVLKRSGQL